tara:strand:+ start:639 stop:1568 length:930 start_codon:yes stop_codon:yes gene_type:complete
MWKSIYAVSQANNRLNKQFFTTDSSLRNKIRQISNSFGGQSSTCFLSGPKGSGKLFLAKLWWHKSKNPQRHFTFIPSKSIQTKASVERLFDSQDCADFYFASFDHICQKIRSHVLNLKKNYPQHRLILSSEKETVSVKSFENLAYVNIKLPALEKRGHDALFLSLLFLSEFDSLTLTKDASRWLQEQTWHEGILELKFLVFFAAIYHQKLELSEISSVGLKKLHPLVKKNIKTFHMLDQLNLDQLSQLVREFGLHNMIKTIEKYLTYQNLFDCSSCQTQASKLLSLPLTTLTSKLHKAKSIKHSQNPRK